MPSEIQAGDGMLYGITNSGSPITIDAFATFTLDSTKGQHKVEIDDIKDANNFDTAAVATNGHIELDVTFTPSGATRTAAAATAVFLTPLSKVTLANFKVSAFNGDYQYRGEQSIDLSHKEAKITLKLRKYDNSDQNASLTTIVSG